MSDFQKPVEKLSDFIKSHFFILIGCTVFLSALFPHFSLQIKDFSLFKIPTTSWSFDIPTLALFCMMFSASTQCKIKDFLQITKEPRAFLVGLTLFYVIIPLVGWVGARTGMAVLGPVIGPQIGAGVALVILMPAATTSNIWVKLAKGNSSLLITFITLTATLSIIFTPIYLSLILGLAKNSIHVPTEKLVSQLFLGTLIPMVGGIALRELFDSTIERWKSIFSLSGCFGLHLAVFANMGVAIPELRKLSLAMLAAVIALTFFTNLLSHFVAYFVSRLSKLPYEDQAAIAIAGGMRSNGTALVIGLKSFSAFPLITVPAAITCVLQHLVAGHFVKFIERRRVAEINLKMNVTRLPKRRSRKLILIKHLAASLTTLFKAG